MDSFADDPLMMAGGSTEGELFHGSMNSLENRFPDQNHVPYVTPGASPLHRGNLEEEEEYFRPLEDRTVASFAASCFSVGSHTGDHSLASGGPRRASGASLASAGDIHSGIFSTGDTLRSTDSISSRR